MKKRTPRPSPTPNLIRVGYDESAWFTTFVIAAVFLITWIFVVASLLGMIQ